MTPFVSSQIKSVHTIHASFFLPSCTECFHTPTVFGHAKWEDRLRSENTRCWNVHKRIDIGCNITAVLFWWTFQGLQEQIPTCWSVMVKTVILVDVCHVRKVIISATSIRGILTWFGYELLFIPDENSLEYIIMVTVAIYKWMCDNSKKNALHRWSCINTLWSPPLTKLWFTLYAIKLSYLDPFASKNVQQTQSIARSYVSCKNVIMNY